MKQKIRQLMMKYQTQRKKIRGSLNFLSNDDHIKVQRLLDLCQENNDVATQTERVIVIAGKS